MKLSVALAVYNEEKNIQKCLSSIKNWADEIVLVDGGSTDKTVEIAKHFGAKIIITDNPPIFHINKQKALNICSGDWILQLDADEVVTQELKKEITTTINSNSQMNGYYIPRKNYFLGQWMKKGGLYPDYVIRLLKKGKGRFPCKSVHEQIEIEGKVGYLKNDLLHFTNPTISDYWNNSVQRYAALTAQEILNKNKKNSVTLSAKYLFTMPIYTFFNRYIKHKGVVDGFPGLIFALGSAIHYPVAYYRYLKAPKPFTKK